MNNKNKKIGKNVVFLLVASVVAVMIVALVGASLEYCGVCWGGFLFKIGFAWECFGLFVLAMTIVLVKVLSKSMRAMLILLAFVALCGPLSFIFPWENDTVGFILKTVWVVIVCGLLLSIFLVREHAQKQ